MKNAKNSFSKQVNNYKIRKLKYMGVMPKENYTVFRGNIALEHFINLDDAIEFAKNN